MADVELKPIKLFMLCTLGIAVIGWTKFRALFTRRPHITLKDKLFVGIFVRETGEPEKIVTPKIN